MILGDEAVLRQKAAEEDLITPRDSRGWLLRLAVDCDQPDILKRLLVHAGGFNLALMMRKLVGIGKPRRLQGAFADIFACFGLLILYVWSVLGIDFRFKLAKQETAVTF